MRLDMFEHPQILLRRWVQFRTARVDEQPVGKLVHTASPRAVEVQRR